MVRRGRFVRTGVLRTVNQVAVSVVATIIATTLYSGLRHEFQGPSAASVAPALTAGGKLAARAEAPFLPTPTLPVSSIVNWTLTPPRSNALIDDVDWQPFRDRQPFQDRSATAPLPPPKPRAHDFRRPSTAAAPLEALATKRPSPMALPDQPTPPPAVMIEVRDTGFWSATRSVTRSALQTVASLGGSVVGRVLH